MDPFRVACTELTKYLNADWLKIISKRHNCRLLRVSSGFRLLPPPYNFVHIYTMQTKTIQSRYTDKSTFKGRSITFDKMVGGNA